MRATCRAECCETLLCAEEAPSCRFNAVSRRCGATAAAATHAKAGLDDLHILDDLDGALVNLGRDVERLEERRLCRVEAGRARRDKHVDRRQSASARGGGHLVAIEHLLDVGEVAVRHDEGDVLLEVGDQVVELRALGRHVVERLAHLRVLAVEHLGRAAERHLDVLHLLRADVVDTDDEHALILGEKLGELREVLLLTSARRHG
jgi:hypothetical protein